MSVGYKIKVLRKKRKMTQNTLAENIVSRSMLSRIESGSAEPSMSTLVAIASKLDVSPSFLLEEDDNLLPAEQAYYSKKIIEYVNKGLYTECLALFDNTGPTIQQNLSRIYLHCAFNLAYIDFSSGRFSNAKKLLELCLEYLDYAVPAVPLVNKNNISILFEIINGIDDVQNLHRFSKERPDFSFQPSLFLYLLKLFNDGKSNECEALINNCDLNSFFSNYIKAQMLIKDYKLIDALLLLKKIASGVDVPLFLRLMCYRSLEDCCKLCEDYKGAYETHLLYSELVNGIE